MKENKVGRRALGLYHKNKPHQTHETNRGGILWANLNKNFLIRAKSL